VTGPLFPVIAALVVAESGRPVLYRARRVGRGGREFSVLKFRTMRTSTSGPAVTASGDRRITKVGRVLRKTKLDELPQLFNVLRGEMSIVGPRPEDPRYVLHYSDVQRRLLDIRPGITGAAAVAFRDEESLLANAEDLEFTYIHDVLPQKLDLELRYLERPSLWADVQLLLATAAAVLRRPT
jgi:lipopolysaccharide/colanic/teichoic acid biosynthesis glycosyltransferase